MDIDSLLYLEKEGSSTVVYEVGGAAIVSVRPFKEYEEILFDRNFFKLSPSILINLMHVSQVNKSNKIITLSGNISIPVTAEKLTLLLESIERLWNYK